MKCDHCDDSGKPRQVRVAENGPVEYHILCDLCHRLWKHSNTAVPVRMKREG